MAGISAWVTVSEICQPLASLSLTTKTRKQSRTHPHSSSMKKKSKEQREFSSGFCYDLSFILLCSVFSESGNTNYGGQLAVR